MASRRLTLARAALGAIALAAAAFTGAARAQADWPSRTIHLVVPFAAGGTSDVLARVLGAQLQAALKQTVLIDNKAGAGGVIGADNVAKSPGDGYTLLLGTIATHAINPALLPKMPYDAAKDFAPVILLGSISNVLLVGPETRFRSVKDVVDEAKAHPHTLLFASAGQGTSQHLSGETFKLLAGIDITHVPYKGSAPAIQDVMAGQVPMSFETSLVALPMVGAGKVRALAVTSTRRTRVLPDTPTMQEAGIAGFDVASWQAIYAPASTPAAIVHRLNAELTRIIALPEVRARMDGLGLEYAANTPEQFAAFQKSEQAKWAKIVKEGNVKPE